MKHPQGAIRKRLVQSLSATLIAQPGPGQRPEKRLGAESKTQPPQISGIARTSRWKRRMGGAIGPAAMACIRDRYEFQTGGRSPGGTSCLSPTLARTSLDSTPDTACCFTVRFYVKHSPRQGQRTDNCTVTTRHAARTWPGPGCRSLKSAAGGLVVAQMHSKLQFLGGNRRVWGGCVGRSDSKRPAKPTRWNVRRHQCVRCRQSLRARLDTGPGLGGMGFRGRCPASGYGTGFPALRPVRASCSSLSSAGSVRRSGD